PPPTPHTYTLSLHDALPISCRTKPTFPGTAARPVETEYPLTITAPDWGQSNPAISLSSVDFPAPDGPTMATHSPGSTRKVTSSRDRKSTRLNSSHLVISYAV